jgi:hypothetical protein
MVAVRLAVMFPRTHIGGNKYASNGAAIAGADNF